MLWESPFAICARSESFRVADGDKVSTRATWSPSRWIRFLTILCLRGSNSERQCNVNMRDVLLRDYECGYFKNVLRGGHDFVLIAFAIYCEFGRSRCAHREEEAWIYFSKKNLDQKFCLSRILEPIQVKKAVWARLRRSKPCCKLTRGTHVFNLSPL